MFQLYGNLGTPFGPCCPVSMFRSSSFLSDDVLYVSVAVCTLKVHNADLNHVK